MKSSRLWSVGRFEKGFWGWVCIHQGLTTCAPFGTMSNYIRPKVPGASVFFTVNLAQRGGNLLVREIDLLRKAVRRVREERTVVVEAWGVMPDHMHAVWTMPEGDADYSTRWGAIKSRFVMDLRRAGFSPPSTLPRVRTGRYAGLKPGLRKHKREAGIWQRRFWEHHIRNDDEFRAYVEYCWFNPVKHGFVDDPGDWPYSSYHRDRTWYGLIHAL